MIIKIICFSFSPTFERAVSENEHLRQDKAAKADDIYAL